jgi:hypothetical protein
MFPQSEERRAADNKKDRGKGRSQTTFSYHGLDKYFHHLYDSHSGYIDSIDRVLADGTLKVLAAMGTRRQLGYGCTGGSGGPTSNRLICASALSSPVRFVAIENDCPDAVSTGPSSTSICSIGQHHEKLSFYHCFSAISNVWPSYDFPSLPSTKNSAFITVLAPIFNRYNS